MPEQPPSIPEVRAKLQELTEVLRGADHLEPETQDELADLLDELSRALDPAVSSAAGARLGANVAHLVEALHQQQDTTLLAAAMERLRKAAMRAEAEAPLVTGIVRRLIDTLSNLGI
jgi:hypothetical protein